MKIWDDITPKTNHNQVRAIMDSEKRRQGLIDENATTYKNQKDKVGAPLFAVRDYVRILIKGAK